jgi:hypothetical protein
MEARRPKPGDVYLGSTGTMYILHDVDGVLKNMFFLKADDPRWEGMRNYAHIGPTKGQALEEKFQRSQYTFIFNFLELMDIDDE